MGSGWSRTRPCGGMGRRLGGDARGGELLQVGVPVAGEAIDPQPEGGLGIAGARRSLANPGATPSGAGPATRRETASGPHRVLSAWASKVVALALEAPQQGIDEFRRPALAQDAGRRHAGGDGGVGGNAGGEELVEADEDQGLQVAILGLEGFAAAVGRDGAQARQQAQGAITQLLDQGPVAFLVQGVKLFQGLGQGAAGTQDGLDDPRRGGPGAGALRGGHAGLGFLRGLTARPGAGLRIIQTSPHPDGGR